MARKTVTDSLKNEIQREHETNWLLTYLQRKSQQDKVFALSCVSTRLPKSYTASVDALSLNYYDVEHDRYL